MAIGLFLTHMCLGLLVVLVMLLILGLAHWCWAAGISLLVLLFGLFWGSYELDEFEKDYWFYRKKWTDHYDKFHRVKYHETVRDP